MTRIKLACDTCTFTETLDHGDPGTAAAHLTDNPSHEISLRLVA